MSGTVPIQGIPQRMTAFVDENTGLITASWYLFLKNVWTRQGGALPSINDTPIGDITPSTGAFTTLAAQVATFGAPLANVQTLAGAASGSGPTVTVSGLDTDINYRVVPKGAGLFETVRARIGTSDGVFSALTSQTILKTQYNPTFTTTSLPGAWFHGGYQGTITSGQSFYNQFSAGSDSVDASAIGGTALLYVGHTVSAGAKGGRTALGSQLDISGAITASPSGNGSYYVAFDAIAQSSASAGGAAGAGNQRGNLFGSNPGATINTGSGLYWNSVIGEEVNVGASVGTGINYKNGLQIVQLNTDFVAGAAGVDSGLLLTTQTGGTVPGWNTGISFGHPLGWWPMKSTGTMIGTNTGFAGSPTYAAAYGVNFANVTVSTAAFNSTGFTVDGTGKTTAKRFFASFAGQNVSGFNPLDYSGFLFGTPSSLPYRGWQLGFNDQINAEGNYLSYFTVIGRWGGTGTRGSRTGAFVSLGSDSPSDSADTSTSNNMVAYGADIYSTNIVVKSGAYAGNEHGGFWGFNNTTRPASAAIIDLYGAEFDVFTSFEPLNKIGVGVVQLNSDAARGKRGDMAISIGNQTTALTTWRNGLSFGSSNGFWAFATDSTLVGVELNATSPAPAGPSPVARWGVDLVQVAFTSNGGFLRSVGMAVSPTGTVGGQGVYGTTLTTTKDVQAQTASVASLTVLDGGNFPSIPALTIDAPPAGVTATATVATVGVASVENIDTRGTSGFAVNDVMTLSGGTFTTAAQVKITAVEAGLPVAFSVQTVGSYTVLPASPVTLTGGSGSGTITITPGWKILTTTVTVAGSGYAVYPPPRVTSATGTAYHTRMELVPQMTPASADMRLNPSGGAVSLGQVFTVAGLPAAGTAGRRAFVSNATATTFASVVAGGGANQVPVYDDGTNWRIG